MNNKVRIMLEEMYGLFGEKFSDPLEAWDRFIEFLAVDYHILLIYQLNHRFEWLFTDKELVRKLVDIYKLVPLIIDSHDHLGDMYFEKVLSKHGDVRNSIHLPPVEKVRELAEQTMSVKNQPGTVLDPAVGVGRLVMAAHKIAPEARYFGADKDLRSLRIAFTNLAIRGIESYLLHADNQVHELDISTEAGKHNWQFANNWYSCIDKLKPIQEVKQQTHPS